MSAPVAEVEIRARSQGFAAGLREARAQYKAFADSIQSENGRMSRGKGEKGFGIAGALGVAGGNLMAGAVSKGIGFLEDMGKSVFDYNDKLIRLQIASEETPASTEAFSQAIRQASDATGVAKDRLVDAGTKFVELTGDMQGATSQLGTWALVAQASHTDIVDVASSAASLGQVMGVKPEGMLDALQALVIEGKKGAVEFRNFAGLIPGLAPQWGMFKGGSGVQGVRELGATLEVIKKGFGTAEEAGTGLQGLLTAIVKFAPRFEKAGVQIFDTDAHGKKHLKGVLDILDGIGRSKLINDPELMEKAFGRNEAFRAQLQAIGLRGEIDELIASSSKAGVLQQDLATYAQSTAGKVNIAWEQAKNKMAEVFTPERIQAFGNALAGVVDLATRLVSALGQVAAWIEANDPKQQAAKMAGSTAGLDADTKEKVAAQSIVAAGVANDGANSVWGYLAGIASPSAMGAIGSFKNIGNAYAEAGMQEFASVDVMRQAQSRAKVMGPQENPYGQINQDYRGAPYSKGEDTYQQLRSAMELIKPTWDIKVQIGDKVIAEQVVHSSANREKVAK